MKFLLDTNIISAAIAARPDSRVLERLTRHEGQIAISSVTWHELRFGVESMQPSRRRAVLEEFLTNVVLRCFEILPYDALAAAWHARERARLRRKGRAPEVLDAQVAAVAAVHGLTLVTDNLKHFERFEGLTIENWLSARLH